MTVTQSTQSQSSVDIVPGTWNIDASHTQVEFTARHLMVTKVRGRFSAVTGSITIAEDPFDSHVEAVIETASVSTGDDKRDGHLKSADFFNVEEYPEMKFASTAVRPAGKDRFEVDGELTILDVTRPVTLELEYLGTFADPWGGTRAGFSATTEISRKDWGLEWNVALESGGLLVSDKVRINLEVQATQA
jgi:polyisoprenoid-binding protein YceI